MFGLLGPNGAGKTTLMRILAGVLRPTTGSARVGGADVATPAGALEVRRRLGYLPQDLGLYPDLTAREFLDYAAILKGLRDGSARRRRVAEILELVALGPVADRPVRALCGGMRRRVGIAQALVGDPALLIVDEPTAGLDPEERVRFRNLLVEVGGSRTVLLSTHIVEDVAQSCRRLAVIAGGRVRFQGTLPELLGRARGHVFTVTTSGDRPAAQATVISAVPTECGAQYRLVAADAPPGAEPAEPGLEDAYMWLMRGPQDAA